MHSQGVVNCQRSQGRAVCAPAKTGAPAPPEKEDPGGV